MIALPLVLADRGPRALLLAGALALPLALAPATAPAQAAQGHAGATIDICIKKAGPRKGSIRFVQAPQACKGPERPLRVAVGPDEHVSPGVPGEPGLLGPVGPAGPQGVKGERGPQGDEGAQGIQGEPGAQGPAGPIGPEGPIAPEGPTGPVGPEGPAGPIGPEGPTGPQGVEGDQGEPGPPGIQGPPGDDGKDGADGRTVLNGEGPPEPKTGENGDFYIDTDAFEIYGPKLGAWSAGTSLVGPQGPRGEKGEQGPPGPAGSSLWAVVSATGTLVRGSGVVAASGPSANVFTVEFNADVSGCAYLSVPGETGTATPDSEPPGFAVPTGHASNANAVRVKTYDKGGSVANRSFHLTVTC